MKASLQLQPMYCSRDYNYSSRSPWVLLKDLGTCLGETQSDLLSWGAGGSEWHHKSTWWGESWPIQWAGGGPRVAPTAEKSTEGQEMINKKNPPRHFPGQSTAGQGNRAEVTGSPQTFGPGKENEVEGAVAPRQGLSGTSTALMQRQ